MARRYGGYSPSPERGRPSRGGTNVSAPSVGSSRGNRPSRDTGGKDNEPTVPERSAAEQETIRKAKLQAEDNKRREDAIRQINERSKLNPMGGMPSLAGPLMQGMGAFNRQNIVAGIKAGGEIIYDDAGKVQGVVTDGALGKVYSGIRFRGYTGAFANLVADNVQRDEGDRADTQTVAGYSGGPLDEDQDATGINLELPDAPTPPADNVSGTGEEATAAKRRSKMGRESTIATSPRGLLTPARTRRRSLMAGLIQ